MENPINRKNVLQIQTDYYHLFAIIRLFMFNLLSSSAGIASTDIRPDFNKISQLAAGDFNIIKGTNVRDMCSFFIQYFKLKERLEQAGISDNDGKVASRKGRPSFRNLVKKMFFAEKKEDERSIHQKFAQNWANLYMAVSDLGKDLGNFDYSSPLNFRPLSPNDENKWIWLFVNKLYQIKSGNDGNLLDPDKTYIISPNDVKKVKPVIFTIDQMIEMDGLLFMIFDALEFLNIKSSKSFFTKKSKLISKIKYGSLKPWSFSSALAALDAVNEKFLRSSWRKFAVNYDEQEIKLPFSGAFAPCLVRIKTELDLTPRTFLNKGIIKIELDWPTAENLDNKYIFRFQADSEIEIIFILEKMKILERIYGKDDPSLYETFLTYLKDPIQISKIMSKKEYKGAGYTDTIFILNKFFAFITETLDAGEYISHLDKKTNTIIEIPYGKNKDDHTEFIRNRLHMPIIHSVDRKYIKWYQKNAKIIGKYTPLLERNDFLNLLSGMVYLNVPEIRAAIEQQFPGIFDHFNNEPLRIMLFLQHESANTKIKVPVFSWQYEKVLDFEQDFFILCGFTNAETAAGICESFGVSFDSTTFKQDIFDINFVSWWEDYDNLIKLLKGEKIKAEIKDYEHVFRLFNLGM
ncbi:MAG: hypothetical protein K9W44_00185 [Candidatus Lokiarchaeota archaeon]|nr:hypothetical protein [Candidatus Harpocratesius repetitus]